MVCSTDKSSFPAMNVEQYKILGCHTICLSVVQRYICTCIIIHLAIVISSILSQMKSTSYCTQYWITIGCDLSPSNSCSIRMPKTIGRTNQVILAV
jgi:hypothetical protein